MKLRNALQNPRVQLTALWNALLLLALVALGLAAGLTLQATRLGDLDAVLNEQARIVLAAAQQTGDAPLNDEGVVTQALRLRTGSSVARLYRAGALVWSGGTALQGDAPVDQAFLESSATRALQTIGDWRVLSRREGTLVVAVAQSLTVLNETMRAYWQAAISAIVVIALVAALLTNVSIQLLLRPLQQLATRAQQLDSKTGVPGVHLHGEVGDLARAFERGVAELNATRAREAQFLANASHELRTPVTALLADLEQILTRQRSGAELLAAVQRSQHTATHLKDLASNLLAISRSNASAAPVRVETNLLELALDVTDRFVPLAANKGLELEADGDNAVVAGDPVLLAQLLENLIANAVKYTPSGAVQVRVHSLEASALLSVEDSGIGIPEDKRARLFEPFERAHLEHRDGFGLGLAVVRSVVDGHGGTVRVHSTVGRGTRVEVSLPSV
jgi:signal transduction histidine kinase